MSKPGSKEQEVLQFLDSLDSLPAPPPASSAPSGTPSANPGEAAEALAFLDEITQKSLEAPPPRASTPSTRTRIPLNRPGTPSLRNTTQVASGRKSTDSPRKSVESTPNPPVTSSQQEQPAQSGWGWGSVWSSASAALQQAKTVVDEVKSLPANDQTRKWSEGMMEYVKQAQLDKLGQTVKAAGLSTLTDILNVVAPPIAEHEVIRVWLSHDMQGYEGVENLVYRSLAHVMEQVEGGDLVVNKGNESRPKDTPDAPTRNLNIIEGFDEALKLAEANIQDLINTNAPKDKASSALATATQNPTTYTTIYLRIQPFTSSPFPTPKAEGEEAPEPISQLQFILHLTDPSHSLTHTTVTQAVPAKWVGIWDEPSCEWVEDLVVEVLRVGVQVIGQDYLVRRMRWADGSTSVKDIQEKGEDTAEPKASSTNIHD